MRNWSDGCIQRVTANGSASKWKPVTSGVSPGSVLGPILLDIFISDTDSEIECTLNKFADDAKLSVVDVLEGWDAIQRDPDKLEQWACVDLMKFNKAKCRVLHVGQGSHQYQNRLGDECVESSPEEKDLKVLVDKKIDMTWQRALAAQQASRAPGCIPSSVGTGRGRGFCPSAPLC